MSMTSDDQTNTDPLDQLLWYLWDNNATDLHLCAGTPPRVRVDGKLWSIPSADAVTVASGLSFVGAAAGAAASSLGASLAAGAGRFGTPGSAWARAGTAAPAETHVKNDIAHAEGRATRFMLKT